jgi:radical SAM protein with 4Fe4S-binding SPASM domain
MTGMKENIAELPEVIRLAAHIGVREVYLQRFVYDAAATLDTPDMRGEGHGLFAGFDAEVERLVSESEALAQALGVKLWASGATTAQNSLASRQEARPWSACLRPWTTAYITANGNALPCCISPFATNDYDTLKLGNILEKPFDDVWNAPSYQQWRKRLLSDHPHPACAGCGVRWSL